MEKTTKKVDTLAIYKDFLSRRSAIDDGAKGKSAEVALKNFINPNSKLTNYVTDQHRNYDIFVMENGKRANIEIKSACGELACLDTLCGTTGDMIAKIYPKSTYIAYCPEICDNMAIEQQFFMFSRDEFIAMCDGYTGRGAIVRVKTPTNNTLYTERGLYRLSFQSFFSEGRPKASKPISEYIWDCCYNQPTVEEWITEREG